MHLVSSNDALFLVKTTGQAEYKFAKPENHFWRIFFKYNFKMSLKVKVAGREGEDFHQDLLPVDRASIAQFSLLSH